MKLMMAARFDMSVDGDRKNPRAYAIIIRQSGIGLPNRDSYLSNDSEGRLRTKLASFMQYDFR